MLRRQLYLQYQIIFLRKIIYRSLLAVLLVMIISAFFYGWRSFPLISGFGAKDLCSCMFVTGRTESDVKKEELGEFPFTLGRNDVNLKDTSVTGSIWGMAKRKTIYRRGLGCTLVNEIDESQLRKQSFNLL